MAQIVWQIKNTIDYLKCWLCGIETRITNFNIMSWDGTTAGSVIAKNCAGCTKVTVAVVLHEFASVTVTFKGALPVVNPVIVALVVAPAPAVEPDHE